MRQRLRQLALEFKNVAERRDGTRAFWVDLHRLRVLDEGLLNLEVLLKEVALELIDSLIIGVHGDDLLADLEAVILAAHLLL